MFLSLDDSKGKPYWRTTATFTRPFAGLVAQRTTRQTTNQEIAGSNPAKLRGRLFTPMFSVFGETEQDSPVDRYKNFAATKRRNDQSARTFTVLRRLFMNVYPRMLEQEKKRQAQMPGCQSIGWQKPYSTTRSQLTVHSNV